MLETKPKKSAAPEKISARRKKQLIALTQSRVRTMEARKIEGGARRMPGGLLQPEAAQAIEVLIANGFAPNTTQVINLALIECAAKLPHQCLHEGSAEK